MEPTPEEKTAKFLLDASLLYEEKCAELSRFLLQLPFKVKGLQKKNRHTFSRLLQSVSVCTYCYQWLKPNNHRVRLRPKRRPSARVQRVLLRQARGKRLSLVQKKLLLRFQKSPSVLVRCPVVFWRVKRQQLKLASTCPQSRGNSAVIGGVVKIRGGMWHGPLSLAPRFHTDERSMATAKWQQENIL
ncbi:hypothetical protein CRENBAI_006035 [Crenichthys baileyi]|uniref:Uncharacterized protein n=1 Tax=Crenichthys baileyi TaxID=28760 RepID=A0AAV9RUU8_9TELE